MVISPNDSESRVRLDMSSFPKSTRPVLSGVLRRWYYVSVLRLLIMEFRNLGHHIRFALQTREMELRGYRGSVLKGMHAPLAFQSQTCKRAYIRYTQRLQAEHPHLCILDVVLLG